MAATWGEPWGDVRYVTPDEHRLVRMFRKGQRCRFFDAEDGSQVGPELPNVVPALVYAAANAWVDPRDPLLSLACTTEVRANMRRGS